MGTEPTVTGRQSEGRITARKGSGLVRKLGMLLSLTLLATGLLAFPAGAGATAREVVGQDAQVATAAVTYGPVIYTTAVVPSGAPIEVEGFGFYAYDDITVLVIDRDGYVVFSGDTITNRRGSFGGYIDSSYFAPGRYTIQVSDTVGAVLSTRLLVTYD